MGETRLDVVQKRKSGFSSLNQGKAKNSSRNGGRGNMNYATGQEFELLALSRAHLPTPKGEGGQD